MFEDRDPNYEKLTKLSAKLNSSAQPQKDGSLGQPHYAVVKNWDHTKPRSSKPKSTYG